jgi:HlyD family secretion protein
MNGKMQRAANRHTRRWLPYTGAVLLVGLITAGLWPRPVPVETTRVVVGTLRATVNEEGKTRIKQRYAVSAPVTGQIRRIPFKAGAQVCGEQTVVAVIEPVSSTLLDARTRLAAEAKRDTAAANLEKARAAQRFAASELRRYEKLFTEKMVSAQELENVQFREASATREQAAAESALREAEAAMAEFAGDALAGTNTVLDPIQVKAPVTGSILHVFEENARVVPAGTQLMDIGDPTDIEVVIECLSRDGAMIPPGTPVDLEQWGGGEPLKAKVRLIEPAAFTKVSALGVEEQRVNVVADLLTPPDQRRGVGDNFRVEARIIVWEAQDVLKVPAGALFRKGEQWAAFVVVDGRARLKIVKAGRSSGAETQVLEGLKQGDEVILYPGSRVTDGQRVTPVTL